MSFALDANVLLYASDQGSPWHAPARRFLDEACAGPELMYLPWPVLMAYLRISTHARVFALPLAPAEAQGNVSELLSLPHVRALGESDGFWTSYLQSASAFVTRGNAVPDAHVAALLLHHGVRTLYTRDADFRRFPGLRVKDPFAEA
ncbi:MAG: TA system VapC family ribonuclease toxin [Acidobacteriota bacterium]